MNDEKGALLQQLEELHRMYHEVDECDARMQEKYAWVIIKALNSDCFGDDSIRSRQFLAEVMHLPLPRPSRVYSALLGTACHMAHRFADFRFAAFVEMWGMENLRKDDFQSATSDDGRTYHSLVERVTKAYMHSLLLRPTEQLSELSLQVLRPVAKDMRYYSPRTMLVVKTTKAEAQGRPMYFARLIDARGLELTCEVHNLQPHPLTATADVRHYVNVGQLYDVLPRERQHFADESGDGNLVRVEEAYLSQRAFGDAYPVAVGYVESYDAGHQYYHVYDASSRHFVVDAALQSLGRFGRPTLRVGDYVQFAPIIPRPKGSSGKVFKTAYVIALCPVGTGAAAFGQRKAKVVFVDAEKKYYRWELSDASCPIVEAGIESPSFTAGYVNFEDGHGPHPSADDLPEVGDEVDIVVYLRRGKDKQKRPKVVAAVKR